MDGVSFFVRFTTSMAKSEWVYLFGSSCVTKIPDHDHRRRIVLRRSYQARRVLWMPGDIAHTATGAIGKTALDATHDGSTASAVSKRNDFAFVA